MTNKFSFLVRSVVSAALLATSIAALAATPTEQNAIVQAGTGGPEALTYKKVPVLKPGEGQVLVKIYAAAINPVDWKGRSGIVGVTRPAGAPAGEGQPTVTAPTPENTKIPGSDVAGVIEQLGPGVTQFKVGDAVFASVGGGRGTVGVLNGGYSEYALASVGSVIAKPKTMTFAQASGLGTATGTGAGAVTRGDVKAGQRVLIGGAAGGVGSAATQMAVARGAHVIAIASGKHEKYLKSLGVAEVIDYTKVPNWEDQVKNVDVAIDTVSAENATKAIKTLKKGGKLVSIVGRIDTAVCTAAGVDCGSNQMAGMPGGGAPGGQGGAPGAGGAPQGAPGGAPGAAPGGAGGQGGMGAGGGGGGNNLTEVVQMANAGKFVINVDATFPLAKAYEAQEENRNGGTQGKIVLIVDAANANKK
ncbi:MAG: NADP-dependent oxidoreductase [Steroidobacteraceae bacterium]